MVSFSCARKSFEASLEAGSSALRKAASALDDFRDAAVREGRPAHLALPLHICRRRACQRVCVPEAAGLNVR